MTICLKNLLSYISQNQSVTLILLVNVHNHKTIIIVKVIHIIANAAL